MDKKYQGISYFFSCIELLAKMEDKRIKMSNKTIIQYYQFQLNTYFLESNERYSVGSCQ